MTSVRGAALVAFLLATHPLGLGAQVQTAFRPADTGPGHAEPQLGASARVSVQDVPLVQALAELRRRSGVPLAYSVNLLSAPQHMVTCSCDDVTVREALDAMLSGTRLQYRVVDSQIVIYPGTASALDSRLASTRRLTATVAPPALAPLQVTQRVTGRVVDATTGQPLSAVQVAILAAGDQMGTLSGSDGRYDIAGVPVGTHTLQAIRIGYAREEREITVTSGSVLVVDLELVTTAIDLDAIVVTGTAGASRRREIGNSIAAVGAERLEVENIVTAQDALAGTVVGLQIVPGSGDPGQGGAVRIRGMGSITQGNTPLFYVDGVRIENSGASTPRNAVSHNPLNNINPHDIERIEVIKGAAATTLYGTEASAGVIQIFTKRGSGGAAQWEMGITQEATWAPSFGPDELPDGWLEDYPDYGESLWMDKILRTGWNQEYNLSVRGGGTGVSEANYFIAARWLDQEGYIPVVGSQQMTLRGNVGYAPTGWLSVEFNNSFAQIESEQITQGDLRESLTLNIMRGPADYFAGSQLEDVVLLDQHHRSTRTNQFTSGIILRATPISDLQATLKVGLDYYDDDAQRTDDFQSHMVPAGSREQRRTSRENRTVDLAMTYDRDLAGVSTATSAGFQVFERRNVQVFGTSEQFAGPGQPTLNSGSIRNVTESRLREVNAGFFVQEVLGFGDRLFLTGGLRMDGNSAFGEDYGLQAYPKVSVSYVISEEPFWPSFFDDTKLRAAYGEAGRAPGSFDAVRTWAPVPVREGRPGVTPANQGNPNLGPERSREIEVGFETTMLDSRLALDFTAYTKSTLDALIEVPQDPTSSITDSQIENVGEIQNRGLEIAADATLMRRADLTWTFGAAASFSESEVKDLGGTESIFLGGSFSPGQFIRVGYPLPSYFGQVVQNPDEFAAPVKEEEFIGPMWPTRLINLNTQVRFGDLTLSARMEHQGGAYQLVNTIWNNVVRGTWPGCYAAQQAWNAGQQAQVSAYDRWKCIQGGGYEATAHVYALDYWKLRSVQLTYRAPDDFLGGNLGRLTFTVAARNLLTITDYPGVDPDVGDSGLIRREAYHLPMARALTFGVRSQF